MSFFSGKAQALGCLPHAQRLPKGTPGVAVKFLGFGGGAVSLALMQLASCSFCSVSPQQPEGLGIWDFLDFHIVILKCT